MKTSLLKHIFWYNFLGESPNWLKVLLVIFLIFNPLVFFIDPFVSGWLLVIEFIFILTMSLKCYPLIPGGLLTIEAVMIGMTTPERIYDELTENLEVLLLLIFMIAGVFFMKQLLLFIFTRLLLSIENKSMLSIIFCFVSAFLSAFLDALTVVSVMISVAISLYNINQKVISSLKEEDRNIKGRNIFSSLHQNEKIQKNFRSFLRSLMMHSSIGTALGGAMTTVGEPQNLIIAQAVGWNFNEFFLQIAPVSLPIFAFGLMTCWLVEKFSLFGYGAKLPIQIRNILQEFDNKNRFQYSQKNKAHLILQSIIAIWLIVSLGFHLAKAGLVGLSIIIFITSFTGITDENRIREAFTEAFPFTALLTLFFAIVAIVVDQELFTPVIKYAFRMSPEKQLSLFYLFSGLLSSISDNVFVGTIYINEIKSAMEHGIISSQWFKVLAITINAGTNFPSIATPNGQASFLFLLTSSLSRLIRLSYSRMVWMAFPYTIVLTLVGFFFVKMRLMFNIFYH